MRIKECFCSFEHIILHCLKNFSKFCCKLVQRNTDLLSCITAYDNCLVILDIFRSDFDTCRDSKDLLSAELPSRCFIRIVNLYFVSCCLQCINKFICLIKNTFFMLGDRDDHCLYRCDSRWNNKSAVISVYHDQRTNDSCGQSPGCLIYFVKFVILIRILNTECTWEGASEEVACC